MSIFEQLKNKHIFGRSTERLAELEDLRKKLRNNDDVIGRLETNVADKNRHVGHVKEDLIDQDKHFQNLTSALSEKQVQRNTLDVELKLEVTKLRGSDWIWCTEKAALKI